MSCNFLAQGALNKIYTIHLQDCTRYIMRVTLPVYPVHKTRSEVATLRFVRQHCTQLVPRVVAFDANPGSDNELGFEWMLLDYMPGDTLEHSWPTMSWDARELLVNDVVDILATLFQHRFDLIGGVYNSADDVDLLPTVGPIVSFHFFWNARATYDVPRGPFCSSYEWLATRLTIIVKEAEDALQLAQEKQAAEICRRGDQLTEWIGIIDKELPGIPSLTHERQGPNSCDADDDAEDALARLSIANRLLKLLPSIFSPTSPAESCVLHHADLRNLNLLVRDGRLSGVIDWECVSAVPLWQACQIPDFLMSQEREEAPDPTAYALDEFGENEILKEDQNEYQLTLLRAFFLREMRRREPRWVAQYEAGFIQADFSRAVDECIFTLSSWAIKKWLAARETGRDGPRLPALLMARGELFTRYMTGE